MLEAAPVPHRINNFSKHEVDIKDSANLSRHLLQTETLPNATEKGSVQMQHCLQEGSPSPRMTVHQSTLPVGFVMARKATWYIENIYTYI